MSAVEKPSVAGHKDAEGAVDVDAVLRELKQAKDRELRLRAEKERVRMELDAVRTGELWSRETAVQQELRGVRERRRVLQQQESVESEELRRQDEALREKELGVRLGRRSTHERSAIQSAAAHLVSTSAAINTDALPTGNSAHASPNSIAQVPPAKSSQLVNAGTSVSNEIANRSVLRTTTHDTSHDSAVTERLRLLVNLDKQEERIRSLQVQLDESHRIRNENPRQASVPHRDSAPCSRERERLEYDLGASKMQQDAVDWRAQQNPHGSAPPKPSNVSVSPLTQSFSPHSQYPSTPYSIVPPYYHQQGYFTPTPCQYPATISPYASPLVSVLAGPAMNSMYAPPVYPPQWVFPPFGTPIIMHPTPFLGSQCPQDPFAFSELRRQVNAQHSNEQRSDDDREFSRVHDMLAALQHQLGQLAKSKSNATMNLSASLSTASIGSDHDDTDLATLKREHQKAMIKVQHERDLLEEEEKLEDAKARVEKRRQGRRRGQEQEESIATPKQELVALRLRRALAKLEPSKKRPLALADVNKLYNPSFGAIICLDFISGLPCSAQRIQLGFAIYDGTVPRTSVKLIESKTNEPEGPNRSRVVIDCQRTVKPLAASIETRLVIEVSMIHSSTVRRIGWTALQLFCADHRTREPRLQTGFHKILLVTTPMPDPSRTIICTGLFPVSESEVGPILFCRVAHGDLEDESRRFTVDPETHAGYYSVPTDKVQVTEEARPVSQPVSPSIPVESSTPTEDSDGMSLQMGQTQQSSVLISRGRDFLDVDRLRLLSAASSTRSASGAGRPQSPVSATSKTRGIGAGGALPVIREVSQGFGGVQAQPWIAVDKSRERQSLIHRSVFQNGDAFNVYVDASRFLPDNVTITKVSVAALHSDRSKLEPHYGSSQLASLDCDPTSPVYNMYLEYRERSFNPTLTLILRFDTIDPRSKEGVIVGYTAFPLFLDAETLQQPSRSDQPRYSLNSGSFQLPIYASANLSGEQLDISAASVIAAAPKVSCATILIRVKPASESEDGLSVLSRKDIPSHEWIERGLEEPFHGYGTGEYDSTACAPSQIETIMYNVRAQRGTLSNVRETIRRLGLSESAAADLLQNKPPTNWDLSCAFKYQPAIGFRVAIDGMHNVKVKGDSFCKVIFSVSPPASFYRPVRLSGGVQLVVFTDWTSLPTSPEFKDGFVAVRDVPFDPKLAVIIDIRAVSKNPKTGTYTSQPLAWSFLPVFNETEGVASGSFQLPLLAGGVSLAVIESLVDLTVLAQDIALEKRNPHIMLMEGASVFVRLEDPQNPLFKGKSPMVDAIPSKLIPARSISKYRYDISKLAVAKKKAPLSKRIPSGMTEAEFEKTLNAAISSELGLEYPRC